LESRFDPNFIVTIGVNCQHVTMPYRGKNVHLQIWDAAGQERFRTITPNYYAKAHAVMIVYDITNHSSFRSVEYWKQQVDAHAGHDGAHVPVVVVGNKTDLVDEHTVSLRIARDDEEQLSDKLGVPVRPVSAKHGDGVDEAFNELIGLAEQQCLSQTGKTFLRPAKVSKIDVLARARNSFVQRCRWPQPKRLLNRSHWGFKRRDSKQRITQSSLLKSQGSGVSSNTSSSEPKSVPLEVAKLGLEGQAEAKFVGSVGDRGQSPVPATGFVTPYWVRIGPPLPLTE